MGRRLRRAIWIRATLMLLCAVPTLGGADYRVAAIEFFGHKGAWKGPPEAIVEALARDRGAHGAL